jgi:hypothetical protein
MLRHALSVWLVCALGAVACAQRGPRPGSLEGAVDGSTPACRKGTRTCTLDEQGQRACTCGPRFDLPPDPP